MHTSKRIFSGVQPSGDLHIGNYLGAIKNFVSLQKEYECFFCVVDLHAITVWQDPQQLADKTREVTAAFIASGIDSDKNVLFHLHGYDIEKLVKAGEPTEIDFTAKASGSFPFTIHESESTEEHESHENASHGHHEDGHEEVSVAEDELELGRLDVLPN